MIPVKPPALVLLVSSLLLGGCQLAPPADTTLSVVVGLYPYAYLAEAIGGDQVSVTNLTKPGAEPHDLELTTQQVIAIAQSDLTIYNASLQPAVDAAVAQAQPAHIIEASATVSEHLHAGDGGHDQGTLDPHTWLDPTLMIELARPIAAQLSAIDPANAATSSPPTPPSVTSPNATTSTRSPFPGCPPTMNPARRASPRFSDWRATWV